MQSDMVRRGYDEAAGEYSSTRDQFKSDKYLDKLIQLLPSGSRILDVGCGSGVPIDRYLLDKGFEVTGIDISEKQIALARKSNPEATYEVKDMKELRSGEYHVDAVVSFYAIFHTSRETHLELLQKFNSYLKHGGLLLVTMGAAEWEGTEENFHGVKMFWSHYAAEKNKEMIETAGFDVIFDTIDTDGGEKHLVVLARKR